MTSQINSAASTSIFTNQLSQSLPSRLPLNAVRNCARQGPSGAPGVDHNAILASGLEAFREIYDTGLRLVAGDDRLGNALAGHGWAAASLGQLAKDSELDPAVVDEYKSVLRELGKAAKGEAAGEGARGNYHATSSSSKLLDAMMSADRALERAACCVGKDKLLGAFSSGFVMPTTLCRVAEDVKGTYDAQGLLNLDQSEIKCLGDFLAKQYVEGVTRCADDEISRGGGEGIRAAMMFLAKTPEYVMVPKASPAPAAPRGDSPANPMAAGPGGPYAGSGLPNIYINNTSNGGSSHGGSAQGGSVTNSGNSEVGAGDGGNRVRLAEIAVQQTLADAVCRALSFTQNLVSVQARDAVVGPTAAQPPSASDRLSVESVLTGRDEAVRDGRVEVSADAQDYVGGDRPTNPFMGGRGAPGEVDLTVRDLSADNPFLTPPSFFDALAGSLGADNGSTPEAVSHDAFMAAGGSDVPEDGLNNGAANSYVNDAGLDGGLVHDWRRWSAIDFNADDHLTNVPSSPGSSVGSLGADNRVPPEAVGRNILASGNSSVLLDGDGDDRAANPFGVKLRGGFLGPLLERDERNANLGVIQNTLGGPRPDELEPSAVLEGDGGDRAVSPPSSAGSSIYWSARNVTGDNVSLASANLSDRAASPLDLGLRGGYLSDLLERDEKNATVGVISSPSHDLRRNSSASSGATNLGAIQDTPVGPRPTAVDPLTVSDGGGGDRAASPPPVAGSAIYWSARNVTGDNVSLASANLSNRAGSPLDLGLRHRYLSALLERDEKNATVGVISSPSDGRRRNISASSGASDTWKLNESLAGQQVRRGGEWGRVPMDDVIGLTGRHIEVTSEGLMPLGGTNG